MENEIFEPDVKVKNGLLDQMRSALVSDMKMLSGFVSSSELKAFIDEAFKHLYSRS